MATARAKAESRPTSKVILGQRVGYRAGGHLKDDAHAAAKASGGILTTLQVRMLRALKAARGKKLTRQDLKTATGHWPNRQGYHIRWIAALKGLTPKYVREEDREPQDGETSRFVYSLTAAGSDSLAKAEKAAKK